MRSRDHSTFPGKFRSARFQKGLPLTPRRGKRPTIPATSSVRAIPRNKPRKQGNTFRPRPLKSAEYRVSRFFPLRFPPRETFDSAVARPDENTPFPFILSPTLFSARNSLNQRRLAIKGRACNGGVWFAQTQKRNASRRFHLRTESAARESVEAGRTVRSDRFRNRASR